MTHPWDLYLICQRDNWGSSMRAEHLQIRYKPNGCVTNVLFIVCEQIKGACVWHEGWFYTAGPAPQNGTGSLADGKPWVSMPLSQNRFTLPTCVTFPAFGLSTNILLMLLTNWLFTLYARSVLCTMANHTSMASQQLSARPSWNVRSLTLLKIGWWKLVLSLLLILKDLVCTNGWILCWI